MEADARWVEAEAEAATPPGAEADVETTAVMREQGETLKTTNPPSAEADVWKYRVGFSRRKRKLNRNHGNAIGHKHGACMSRES